MARLNQVQARMMMGIVSEELMEWIEKGYMESGGWRRSYLGCNMANVVIRGRCLLIDSFRSCLCARLIKLSHGIAGVIIPFYSKQA